MMNRSWTSRISARGRRTLWIALVAVGLVLAWTHAGFATGTVRFTIDANGVVRSDAVPDPTTTPESKPRPTETPHAQPTPRGTGGSYSRQGGVVRSDADPDATPTPPNKARPTPDSGKGGAMTQQRTAPAKSPYSVSKHGNVFTVTRNGAPWVILKQGTAGIGIIDPSGTSLSVVDIATSAH